MRIACANSSCSACANISVATYLGFAFLSAMIKTSDGPAKLSIPTFPKTFFLAVATYMFQVLQFYQHILTVLVPYASAPIA